jgi:hypothetical protein
VAATAAEREEREGERARKSNNAGKRKGGEGRCRGGTRAPVGRRAWGGYRPLDLTWVVVTG